MNVLGSKVELSSNSLTYSYLDFAMDGRISVKVTSKVLSVVSGSQVC